MIINHQNSENNIFVRVMTKEIKRISDLEGMKEERGNIIR